MRGVCCCFLLIKWLYLQKNMAKLKVCAYCLEEIKSKKFITKQFKSFCNEDCFEQYKNDIKLKKSLTKTTEKNNITITPKGEIRRYAIKKCVVCGKEFKTLVYNQKYCGKNCSDLTHISRFKIFERDSFRCIYCGKSSIENKAELHLEHIFPRSKGGTNQIDNVVTSCAVCNLEKSAKILTKKNLERIVIEVSRRNRVYFKGDVSKLEIELDKLYTCQVSP